MRQRTPLTEIGEMRISLADKSFFFKPSFAAMNELGSPKEIVELYATLNGYEYAAVLSAIQSLPYGAQIQVAKILSRPAYGKKVLSAACLIMQSCCDDDISVLIGSWKPTPRGVKYIPGLIPIGGTGHLPNGNAGIIDIARALIEHGIIGKSPLKVPQRSENQKRTTSELRMSDYIISARTHFGITREEAEDLTMTEYQQMIKSKYPEPEGMTREQYDASYERAKLNKQKLKEKAARKAAKSKGAK